MAWNSAQHVVQTLSMLDSSDGRNHGIVTVTFFPVLTMLRMIHSSKKPYCPPYPVAKGLRSNSA